MVATSWPASRDDLVPHFNPPAPGCLRRVGGCTRRECREAAIHRRFDLLTRDEERGTNVQDRAGVLVIVHPRRMDLVVRYPARRGERPEAPRIIESVRLGCPCNQLRRKRGID